jgi:hypothetical protein
VAKGRNGKGYTIVVTPAAGVLSVIYNFLSLLRHRIISDVLRYILPPNASLLAAPFTLTLL